MNKESELKGVARLRWMRATIEGLEKVCQRHEDHLGCRMGAGLEKAELTAKVAEMAKGTEPGAQKAGEV
jgi:hypothetical protein